MPSHRCQRYVQYHMFVDILSADLKTHPDSNYNVLHKHCPIVICTKTARWKVFGTCWWGTCGCRATRTARRPTCNVMHSSQPGLMKGICSRTRRAARADRSGLAAALDYVRTGDCLVVWKLDRLGRSLPHLLEIVTGLEARQVGFRSLTEQMDTTTPQGAFLFSVFGALAQYERALARERIMAGLEAARRRGRRGGRPRAIDPEKIEAILSALDNGASKAAVCRNFGVKRTTLYHALARRGV